MAGLPDYFKSEQGTTIVWGTPGGSGVTKDLTFNNLASGSGRMGASADLGSTWDREYIVQLVVESGTAPTAGGSVECYLASSHDNTTWPAGVTGSDGAWPTDGNEDEWARQLGLPATVLVATNDSNTTMVQDTNIWRPKGRYVAPVIDVNMDQDIRNQGTPANNTSRLYLTPKQDSVRDTA